MPKEIAPQSRRIIDEGCVELSRKYSPMVSVALFPNETSNHATRIFTAPTHSDSLPSPALKVHIIVVLRSFNCVHQRLRRRLSHRSNNLHSFVVGH